MDKNYSDREENTALYAKALAHPARVAILNFLATQESCFFGEIHEVLPIAKSTVSQHLTELKNAGLIQGEIIAPKVRYCINKQSWVAAQELFVDLFGGVKKKGGKKKDKKKKKNKDKKCCDKKVTL